MINPLICYLRPKDIPQVLDELEKIPCDKLYINYYPYPYPHRIARDYFLAHPEYTHLVMCTNDLVVTHKDYEGMLRNIVNHPMIDVWCGVCNVDTTEECDYWNICFDLPVLKWPRQYNWIHKNSGLKGYVIRVPFAGFPFMWIQRKVMEKMCLNGEDRPGFDGTDLFGKDGYAADLWFCHSLWDWHVPIYCDTNIDMLHLRFFGDMQVGKKEPFVEFINKNLERKTVYNGLPKGKIQESS